MTQESIFRDKLAIERTLMANERTLLAYARTVLGLLGLFWGIKSYRLAHLRINGEEQALIETLAFVESD